MEKTYSVIYSYRASNEATVKARSKREARQKVVEVIGPPVKIELIYEVRPRKKEM